jgi:cell division protein FtsL
MEQVWKSFLYKAHCQDDLVKRKMAQKTSEKKVVGRKVALALGVVCIVLAAGLVVSLVLYAPMVADLQAQAANKDKTIDDLNSQISSLTSRVATLTMQVNSLNTNLSQSYTPDQVQQLIAEYVQANNDLNAKLSLSQSGYLFPQNSAVNMTAGGTTPLWNNVLDYAGYIGVQVESTSNTTYAAVSYSLPQMEEPFEYNVTVGTSGTAVFPVLPGEVFLGLGNTEQVDSVNATVTAVYYY